MLWFLIFAVTVFALYFWRQYAAKQRELNSPLASHRSGHSHIGQVVVLEQGLQNGSGRIRLGNRDWPIRSITRSRRCEKAGSRSGGSSFSNGSLKSRTSRRSLPPI